MAKRTTRTTARQTKSSLGKWRLSSQEITWSAFDRMQERGFTPSFVEDTIKHGVPSTGRGGTTVYRSDQATVILNQDRLLMMTNIFSIPANCTINFEIKGYSTESPECVSDANWLKTLIRLNSNTMTVEVNAFVTTHDLHRFLKELKDVFSYKAKKAIFTTDEGAVFLKVFFDGNDDAKIIGYLKEMDEASVKADFELKIGRGELARTVENLESLLEFYPVITHL